MNREYELADVQAWPDEVFLSIPTKELNLTPDQARFLGNELIAAADDCPNLDWSDDENDPKIIRTDDK